MDKRNVVLLFSVFLVLVGQLLGQGEPIYVSTYTGGQILSVANGNVEVVYTDKNLLPEDITLGPDNNLYVCDSTNGKIIRIRIHMEPNKKNVETVYDQAMAPSEHNPGGPQGPRFNSAGTLFFNTKTTKNSIPSGVWKIDGLAAILFDGQIPDPDKVLEPDPRGEGLGGEGLAFTSNGDLLVVKRSLGEVQCLPGPLNTCPDTITGLTDPIGIAVNSVGDIFVATRPSLSGNTIKDNIQRVTPKNERSTYVEFDPPDQPFYLEFTSDDTLFVATSVTADGTLQNGKLWKVTPPLSPSTMGSKTPLADFAKLPLPVTQPAAAVGVGRATSVSIKKTFTGTQAYNFASNSFEITAGRCTATVTASQKSPADVHDMLAADGIGGEGQPLNGDGGWVTTWLVVPDRVLGCQPVKPPPDDYYGIAILGFVNAPFNISPGIVKCSSPTGKEADPSTPVCVKLPDFGYYPEATTLRGPGDPISGTRSKSFSEYLFVNLELVPPIGNFCGPLPPLTSDPKKTAVFSIGQTIPLKFQLATLPNCTGGFITDAKATLSVAQIELADGTPTFIRKVITPAGSSNDPPVFRYDTALNQYVYNMKNSKSTGWKPGLYRATITSNKFFPKKPPPNPILFRLR